jgi:iron complex outermembrane receptor protein
LALTVGLNQGTRNHDERIHNSGAHQTKGVKSMKANLYTRDTTVTMKNTFIKSFIGLLAICTMFGTAWAQQDEDTAGQLEEVVVTATHRAENIQEIPISVTAISGEALDKADIFDPATVALRVPNMTYGEFSPGQALISLRGVSSVDDGAGLDNSIALFLDGVYIGRLAAINFDMFDLDRLEVLRGPQGTLFGRNAIGGAINAVTSKPTDVFTAKFGGTVGNEGIVRYRGLVSGPFSDSISGKISFTHREHDGYVRNVILGTKVQDENQTSIRGQLRFQTDSSDWILSGDWMEDNRGDMGRTPMVNRAPVLQILAANGGGGSWETSLSTEGFSDREASGVSLTGEIQFDQGLLTTITAVRNAQTDWEMPSVGAPLGAIGLPFDEVIDDIVEDIDTFSQELRWTSDLDGNFSYTAGLYYLREETDRTEIFRITRAGTYGDPSNPFLLTDPGPQDIIGNEYARTANDTKSYAAYAELAWRASERWNFTLGGRYTKDKKDYTAVSVNCDLVRDNDPSIIGTQFENFAECGGVGGSLNIIAEAFEVNPSESWSDFSPKLAAQFFPNDSVMFFGTISKGFKSGGFAGSQGVESVASDPVEPETAWNYEIGMKGDFFDNTLRLNITGFYMDYQDLQIVRFGPVPSSPFGTFITTNVGSADILGLETEFTWLVTDNFQLSGHVALLDTEAQDLVILGMDLSGTELRQAPELSYNISADYFLHTGMGNWDFRLEFSHVDEQLNDYLFTATVIEEQNLLDARIGWTSTNGQWEVSLWGKNLTNEAYFAHSYVIGPGAIAVWGPPRTYGVSATWFVR